MLWEIGIAVYRDRHCFYEDSEAVAFSFGNSPREEMPLLVRFGTSSAERLGRLEIGFDR